MNYFYRLVWNQAVGVSFALAATPLAAQINPTGGVAIQGQATFATTGNHLQVTTQNGAGLNHSAINWQSFSIPAGSSTYFQQPTATSTSINRVVTSTPSLIFGTLGSNGNLVLVNQSGITVGAGAVVDTAGFTASALRMSDADALSGRLRFGDAAASTGAVSVQGSVLARSGDVVLIGSSVDSGSQALLQAPNGSTVLAAGQQIEITGRGLEGIVMQVQAPTDSAVNLGTLTGDAVGIFAGTLKHSGTIQATQVSSEGGRVVLKAAGDTLVDGNARILATSSSGKGGRIEVLGQRVAVTDNAQLDASGATGGGTVLVGGDYQGKNAAVQNAAVTYLGAQASIKADATVNGDGGKVIVWSDDTTRAYGSISARGGASGGNGGFVETSGHRYLDVSGARVDTLAPRGTTGNWLLDPTDITITSGVTGSATFTGGVFDNGVGTSASLTDGEINSQLYNSNITIQTSSGASANGDITFDSTAAAIGISNITTAGSRTLTLLADGKILFTGGNGTSFTATSFPLGVVLVSAGGVRTDAGSGVTLNGSIHGAVMQLAGGTSWNNLGTLTLQGDAQINLADANGSAGSLQNSGTVNFDGTNSFAIYSNSNGLDNGVIHNDGIFNVNQYTAFEAEYNQTGTLNIRNASLNLQNAHLISGTIDLAPAGAAFAASLNLTEQHGNTAAFSNLNIQQTSSGVTNQSQVNVGTFSGPVDATFMNVNAPATLLTIGNSDSGGVSTVTILNGDAAFLGVTIPSSSTGHLAMNNGHLGITSGDFDTFDNAYVSYSGDAGYYATGNLTVAYDLATSGSLKLIAGWNRSLSNPATTAASGAGLRFVPAGGSGPAVTAGGDLVMQASGSLGIAASNAVLTVGGVASATSLAGPVTLDNSANAMHGLAATLSGPGDLTVVNHAPLDIQGINVAAGNVDVDNTGAVSISGAVHVPAGSFTLQAHSPVTVNNIVDANGNILLDALSPDGSSNVTLNGAMNSAAGGITVQAYNDFIQNSRLSAALAINVSTLAGSLRFGPNAFSVGNPVSYSVNGVSYQPPWLSSTLSGGANSYVVAFLDQFQAALDAQFVSSDDPLGLRQRGHEGIVVEGEQCTP